MGVVTGGGGGGGTPTLAQVLTESGDPGGLPITGPTSVTDGGASGNTYVSVSRDDSVGFQVITSTQNGISTTDGTRAFYAGRFGLIYQFNSAPADGDLDPGQCALWFDQTNGAGKLMVKAKTANGTVVTGSLALA